MIPINTTTIRILRPNEADERYEEPGAPTVVEAGIRAVISTSRGAETVVGGSQEVVEFRLTCDPCDLDNLDVVEDETTEAQYAVVWAEPRVGYGLEHVEAGLRRVSGGKSFGGRLR